MFTLHTTNRRPLRITTTIIIALTLAVILLFFMTVLTNVASSSKIQPPTVNTTLNSIQTISVTGRPDSIAFDGTNMWVVSRDDRYITILQAQNGAPITTINLYLEGYPSDIAFDGINMWIPTGFSQPRILVIRASNYFRVMTPTIESNPAISGDIVSDGTNMWVTIPDSNTVSAFRISDGTQVMTSTVGGRPRRIAFDGTNIWVLNVVSNTVNVIRASDGFKVMTPTVSTPGFSSRAIGFDGRNMWIANSDGTANILRASDGVRVMTPTVAVNPRGFAFDGTYMWVTEGGTTPGEVHLIRPSDGQKVMTIPLCCLNGNIGSNGLTGPIVYDGSSMWVTDVLNSTVYKVTLQHTFLPLLLK